MQRRSFLLGALGAPFMGTAALAAPRMQVAKSPTCGCCGAWVEHVRAAGIGVDVTDLPQDELWALKQRLGISSDLSSCHTAQIDGYFVEGHVPVTDVQRLLYERPEGLGLTVPGMPIGSPGMEMGDQRDAYQTLLVLADGTTTVFASHS